jgi:hypothetical protein
MTKEWLDCENNTTSKEEIELEELVNESYIQDFKIEKEKIYRFNTLFGRCYIKKIDDKSLDYKPSVTTIIKKYSPMPSYLLKWFCDKGYDTALNIMKQKSIYGTYVHIVFRDLLLKSPISLNISDIKKKLKDFFTKEKVILTNVELDQYTSNFKQDIIGFIKFIQDYKIKPITTEFTIVGKHYAGSIDLIAIGCFNTKDINKEEIFICDFKTGRYDFYDDYAIQLEAYKQLWNEKYPNYKITRIFNYGCKDFRIPIGKSVTPYRFQEQTKNVICKRWDHYLSMFLEEYPDFVSELKSKSKIRSIVVDVDTDLTNIYEEIPLQTLLLKKIENFVINK